MAMYLSEIKKLLDGTAGRLPINAEVRGVALHSRDVRPGWIFIAVPGTAVDGLQYVEDAIRRGAIAIIAERQSGGKLPVPIFVVPDVRLAAARLAAAFHGWPGRFLQIAAITGTNGKTTTAIMIRNTLLGAGRSPGLIGTVAYEIGARIIPASRTTPDALTVQDLLRQMRTAGCQSAVMEVSSHALVQKRVAEIEFAAACFTNLTHDHLDYHGSMDAYYEAKAILFRELSASATAVINGDDGYGRRLLGESLACRVLSYGLGSGADIRAEAVALSLEGTSFRILSPWGNLDARISLPGIYNVLNALACFGVCVTMGVAPETAAESLRATGSVRGRLERVHAKVPFRVFVDYAHTDDALRNVLTALRPLTANRLILVFGCGGNRDRSKRVLMGRVAVELADQVIVTSDNPRNESPDAIIHDILEGIAEQSVKVVPDRKEAIRTAIEMASAGDTVLIAGKGHETYQEVEDRVIPFDDIEVSKVCLDSRQKAGLLLETEHAGI